MQADQSTGLWDTGQQGDNVPWGGHCLLLWDYSGLEDDDTVTLLTWGIKQKATWRWVKARITEAHGILWPQLKLSNGLYPTGDDIQHLMFNNRVFNG